MYVLCMQFVIKNYFLQPDGSVLFECMLNGNPQPEVNYCLCQHEVKQCLALGEMVFKRQRIGW